MVEKKRIGRKIMAGKKGCSGGARKGAGKKPLSPEQLNTPTPISVTDIKTKKIDKIVQVMQTCDVKDLTCPSEFDFMPYAKQAWKYVLELDKNSKYQLLNSRHIESLKSYCLAVELRQTLIAEWEKQEKAATIITKNGELKINPVVAEITKQNDKINAYATALGLTVLSEFDMAKKAQSSETLSGDKEEKGNENNLFV